MEETSNAKLLKATATTTNETTQIWSRNNDIVHSLSSTILCDFPIIFNPNLKKSDLYLWKIHITKKQPLLKLSMVLMVIKVVVIYQVSFGKCARVMGWFPIYLIIYILEGFMSLKE